MVSIASVVRDKELHVTGFGKPEDGISRWTSHLGVFSYKKGGVLKSLSSCVLFMEWSAFFVCLPPWEPGGASHSFQIAKPSLV